jgi:DNA methyltransferase 1-associated protein 1
MLLPARAAPPARPSAAGCQPPLPLRRLAAAAAARRPAAMANTAASATPLPRGNLARRAVRLALLALVLGLRALRLVGSWAWIWLPLSAYWGLPALEAMIAADTHTALAAAMRGGEALEQLVDMACSSVFLPVVSREVYALMGSQEKNGPPLVPAEAGLKEKRFSGRVARWVWRPFTSSARSDGLVLHHWAPSADKSLDYKFARFNKPVRVPVYTDAEYDAHLADVEWSRAATDELVGLCATYELRFLAVHDRWSGPHTVEQLKERYYAVAAKVGALQLARQADGGAPRPDEPRMSADDPVLSIRFDRAADEARKAAFETLYRREPAQVAAELRLLDEARKIESTLKLAKKEQYKALQQAATDEAAGGGLARAGGGGGGGASAGGAAAAAGGGGGAGAAARSVAKGRPAGAYLRSTELSTRRAISDKGAERFEARLRELGVPARPLPTALSVPLHNGLRHDVIKLVEAEGKIKKLELEVRTLESRYAATPRARARHCSRRACDFSPQSREAQRSVVAASARAAATRVLTRRRARVCGVRAASMRAGKPLSSSRAALAAVAAAAAAAARAPSARGWAAASKTRTATRARRAVGPWTSDRASPSDRQRATPALGHSALAHCRGRAPHK